MALKIRLRKQGRTNRAFYRLVVTDSRTPRDGKYVEALGWYNPIEAEDEKKLLVNSERVQHWLSLGAEMSDNAANLIRRSSPSVFHEQIAKKVAQRSKEAGKRKIKKSTGLVES